MHTPAVSIMIPVRPASPGLGRALASLAIQRVADWEAVVVLDGPCVVNRALVRRFADPRVQLVEFDRQRGRGAARAAALERCRAPWIGFLDADDWYTPTKLATQLGCVDEDSSLEVVTTGMFIVDAGNELRGVRGLEGQGRAGGTIGALPFAPSLVRAERARRAGFDARLRSSEDRAFLAAAVPGAWWRSVADPLYVYDEYGQQDALRSLRSAVTTTRLALREHGPGRAAAVTAARQALRAGGTVAAHAAGLGEWLVARRSDAPSPEQVARFLVARHLLDDELRARGLAS